MEQSQQGIFYLIGTLCGFFLLFMLLRAVVLWYWRVNTIVEILNKTSVSLEKILKILEDVTKEENQ